MLSKYLRITGIILTLISFLSGSVIVTALLIDKLEQEVISIWDIFGQFFYNILIIYFATLSMIGVFIGSIVWGLSLKHNDHITSKEFMVQKLFFLMSTLWLGLILYYNLRSL